MLGPHKWTIRLYDPYCGGDGQSGNKIKVPKQPLPSLGGGPMLRKPQLPAEDQKRPRDESQGYADLKKQVPSDLMKLYGIQEQLEYQVDCFYVH